MEKSKIGITIPLFSALVYVSALLGSIPLIVCAGYILLAEQNRQLRYHAVKALVFVGVLTLISSLISGGNELFDLLNTLFLSSSNSSFRFSYPANLGSVINNTVSVVRNIGLVYMAYQAHKGKYVESDRISKYLSDERSRSEQSSDY